MCRKMSGSSSENTWLIEAKTRATTTNFQYFLR